MWCESHKRNIMPKAYAMCVNIGSREYREGNRGHGQLNYCEQDRTTAFLGLPIRSKISL